MAETTGQIDLQPLCRCLRVTAELIIKHCHSSLKTRILYPSVQDHCKVLDPCGPHRTVVANRCGLGVYFYLKGREDLLLDSELSL